jgi:dihydroflavonol-4-reductase
MKERVLVTGGSGFVASHCMVKLLENGYEVVTTLRSLTRSDEVRELLRVGGIAEAAVNGVRFVEADLTNDKNWAEAVNGCTYVLHVASPIFLTLPKDENEMIRPAVDGTLRVLRAARDAGVKRVVMTSNFGAVGYSHTDRTRPITEESWTNPNQNGLSSYNKSKVLAERAAWDFVKREGGALELTALNPTAVFGPAFNPVLSSSFGLLKTLLGDHMKAIPDMSMGIVDVRDLADLHLRAMVNPRAAGQRFLALSGGTLSLMQVSQLVRRERPQLARRLSDKPLPTWLLRLAAPFSAQARSILPMVGIYRNASNAKARTLLGWTPRPNEEAVVAAIDSMERWGHLKPSVDRA